MKYLFVFEKDGEPIVNLDNYSQQELNGNPIFKIADDTNPPNGYVSINGVKSWHKYAGDIKKDRWYIKDRIDEWINLVGWSFLSDEEKYIAITYSTHLRTRSEKQNFLKQYLNLSQEEAERRYAKIWNEHYQKFRRVCKIRWSVTTALAFYYFNHFVLVDFFSNYQDIIVNYTRLGFPGKIWHEPSSSGLAGVNYDFDNPDEPSIPGLLDWINSAHDFKNNGLAESGYQVTATNKTIQDYIFEVNRILLFGEYEYNIDLPSYV